MTEEIDLDKLDEQCRICIDKMAEEFGEPFLKQKFHELMVVFLRLAAVMDEYNAKVHEIMNGLPPWEKEE